MLKGIVLLLLFQTILIAGREKVLIIGASSGIGRELAILLARTYDVALVARKMKQLEKLKEHIAHEVPLCSVAIKRLDVTEQGAPQQLADFIQESGGVDVAIISITACTDFAQLTSTDAREEALISVDLLGFWRMARILVDYFKGRGAGHLVGISSVDALRGNPAAPVYSASKAFVSRYLEGLRNQLCAQGYQNIYVTDVLPGYVQTDTFNPAGSQGAYWIATVHDAALQIRGAIEAKEKRVFITARWWIIGWLMAHLPDWLFYDVIGGL